MCQNIILFCFLFFKIYTYEERILQNFIVFSFLIMNPEISNESSLVSSPSLYVRSQSDVEKVTTTYLMLHKLFFGIGIYIIILLLSFFVVWNISAWDSTLSFPIRNTTTKLKEQQLMENLSSIESKSYKDNDVRVIIKQWPLTLDKESLTTTNNLITYKGFVLPKTAVLSLNSRFQDIAYFSNSWYDVNYLDLYMSGFIFTSYKSQDIVTDKQMIPLSTTLSKYLELSCLTSPRVTDIFCKPVFDEAVKVLPLYDLSSDYLGLTTISQSIKWTSYYPTFCDAIKKYIFFSNDSEREIRDIMLSCGKDYEESVWDFVSFRSIQEQLQRETISSTVTPSSLLNSYKLLSVLNEIYYEIVVWNVINPTRINGYNNYVEALLKAPDLIQPFYFDVIARYNNNFLMPQLANAIVSTRWDRVNDYKKLLDHLKKLNQWDSIAGYQWLGNKVINPNLVNLWGTGFEYTGSVIELDKLFSQSYDFADFVVRDTRQLDNNTLSVSGLLRFTTPTTLTNNTSMTVNFIYQNQRFFVQSIQLPTLVSVQTEINKQLAIKAVPMSEVYTMILYYSKDQNTTVQNVCSYYSSDKTMTKCTDKQIDFTINKINYSFVYKKDGITSYTISDKVLETSAKAIYGATVSLTKNPLDAISLILSYRSSDNTNNNQTWVQIWWQQEISIQKNFEIIGATINKISQNKWYYVVDFKLKNYNYTAVYDIKTSTIKWLWIIVNKITHVIRNFTFSFDTAKLEELSLFENDPITFLLQKDPLTVKRLALK